MSPACWRRIFVSDERQPAPGKQCGDCSLCCKTMVIVELDKPKDVWCPNFSRGTGCTIYSTRPPSCRDFACQWLLDPAMGPEWKPSRCKMVMDIRGNSLVVHVDPGAKSPWRQEPYLSQLVAMATRNIARGTNLLVMEHGRTTIILPDRAVDLGKLDPIDQIAVSRKVTGTGERWDARVIKPAEAALLVGERPGSA